MHLIRFLRDRRGTAAVEFAFVAPLMILLYCGLAELTQGMMADRRASHVASIIGDLVAQQTQVTPADVTDVFNVGKTIIAPFPSSTLSMRVTSIKADASASPKVAWSQGYSTLTALSKTTTVSGVPTGLMAANESVIMAEVRYVYKSPLGKALPSDLTFNQKYYLKPRKGSEVLCPTC